MCILPEPDVWNHELEHANVTPPKLEPRGRSFASVEFTAPSLAYPTGRRYASDELDDIDAMTSPNTTPRGPQQATSRRSSSLYTALEDPESPTGKRRTTSDPNRLHQIEVQLLTAPEGVWLGSDSDVNPRYIQDSDGDDEDLDVQDGKMNAPCTPPRPHGTTYSSAQRTLPKQMQPIRRLSSSFEAPVYDGAQERTALLDILRMKPSPHPPFYVPNDPQISPNGLDAGKPHVLKETKSVNKRMLHYGKRVDNVRWIVSAPDMLRRFMDAAEEQLGDIWLSWGDPTDQATISLIHPWPSHTNLPLRIHCEKDVEHLSWSSFMRPILHTWKYTQENSAGATFDDENTGPFWTTGDQNGLEKALPDAILITQWESFIEKKIPLVVEIKCDNVLRGRLVRTDNKGERVASWESIFGIFDSDSPSPAGRAMPFIWPSVIETSQNNTLTRVLAQACVSR